MINRLKNIDRNNVPVIIQPFWKLSKSRLTPHACGATANYRMCFGGLINKPERSLLCL